MQRATTTEDIDDATRSAYRCADPFQDSPAELYIAFFYTSTERKYHWALLLSSPARGPPSLHCPSHLYQIVHPPMPPPPNSSASPRPPPSTHSPSLPHSEEESAGFSSEWTTHSTTEALGDTPSFMGVLKLPPLDDVSFSLADYLLKSIPACPPNLLSHERARWTCAWWIVDILVEQNPVWGMDFHGWDASKSKLYHGIHLLAHRLVDGRPGIDYTVLEDGGTRLVEFPEDPM
ncbi:hypothetical protein OF83DRAFT_1191362 [Amylostereum chailletii]|nr:hypothetical protein OF83DRAFT_1191362 [Amylostereum chailletii]